MSSITDHFHFEQILAEEIKQLTSSREGEIKLGQTISLDIKHQDVQFVIVGIEEHIGPCSNNGQAGAENGFQAFLSRFLNMQSNRFLQGAEIAVYGRIKQNITFSDINSGRNLVEELDLLVTETIKPIIELGKIPIVIGGGHNNAFPIIRAISEVQNKKITAINLDPHADCRRLEGRHSGNPFSYAHAAGYLEKYHVLGLHKSYNSEYLLDFLIENNFEFTFFEDYITGSANFHHDIEQISLQVKNDEIVGIELDLDSIAFMPSSAFSPSGFRIEDARYFCNMLASIPKVAYLHLPEGAPLNSSEDKIVGKTLAYLAWDFIHSRLKNF